MILMRLAIFVLTVSTFLAATSDPKTATIFGRVIVLPTGDRAPCAEISVYAIEYQGFSRMQVLLLKKKQTDDRGEYRFSGLQAGQYLIQAWMPGFAIAKVWDISVWSGLERVVDIGINVGGHGGQEADELAGEVKSANGDAVRDATVTAIQFENPGQVFQTRTDLHGRYRLPVTYGGNYAVQIQKPDFRPQFGSIEIHRMTIKNFGLKSK
jgi:protocatechuate 3,4-dioxygenase beta subunit